MKYFGLRTNLDQKPDIKRFVMETALKYYEQTRSLEIRRKDLLKLCLENNSELPTTSFNRALNSLELQMALKKIVNKNIRRL